MNTPVQEHKSNKRVVSMDALYKKKYTMLPFDGEWKAFIGTPEASGVWLVWGTSGNGKTRFCLALSKYLTRFYPVAYNSLEEGSRATFQKAAIENNMKEVARRFKLMEGLDSFEELMIELHRHKSSRVWIIDSFQYLGLTKKQYQELKKAAVKLNKLIIFISHAEGKEPAGKVAKFVRYDVDVKIFVRGYMAFATSRYGDDKPFVISKERAETFYGNGKPVNPTKA